MQTVTDAKNVLREKCKAARLSIAPGLKEKAEDLICESTLRLIDEISPSQVLCYVSSSMIEINTTNIINTLLKKNYEIAVPKCTGNGNDMFFYVINDLSELKKGRFGILEPSPEECELSCITGDSVCIVPGLAFDEENRRIGFGKGYYDKFLLSYRGISVGLCLECCIENEIPHEYHDQTINIVITEKKIRRKLPDDSLK